MAEGISKDLKIKAVSEALISQLFDLTGVIDPLMMAINLISKKIIDRSILERVRLSSSTKSEKACDVLTAVSDAVMVNPDYFATFCDILDSEPVTKDIARILKENYKQKLHTAQQSLSCTCTVLQKSFLNKLKKLLAGLKRYNYAEKKKTEQHALSEYVTCFIQAGCSSTNHLDEHLLALHEKDNLITDVSVYHWAKQLAAEKFTEIVAVPTSPIIISPVAPLFSKPIVYHASICALAVNKTNAGEYQKFFKDKRFVPGHSFKEVSISRSKQDRYLIATQDDSTYYIAFQSEPNITEWPKRFTSFENGINIQADNFPINFITELLNNDTNRVILTGFSFGGMLACSIAVQIWQRGYIPAQLLQDNLVCITFAQPHLPVPQLPDLARDRPEITSTIHAIYFEEDILPRLLRVLDLPCSTLIEDQVAKEPGLQRKIRELPKSAFQDSLTQKLLSDIGQLSFESLNVPPSISEFVKFLRMILEGLSRNAGLSQSLTYYQLSYSTNQSSCLQFSEMTKDQSAIQSSHLTTDELLRLTPEVFKKNSIEIYCEKLFRGYLDKAPEYRIPSEGKAPAFLNMIPTVSGVTIHNHSSEVTLVVEGTNFWFCHRLSIRGESIATPASKISGTSINLNFDKETKPTLSALSDNEKVSLKVFNHFMKSPVTVNVKVVIKNYLAGIAAKETSDDLAPTANFPCTRTPNPFRISIHPKDVSCKPGKEAELILLTAPSATTYQWYFENQAITIQNLEYRGQTTNRLLVVMFFPKNKGIYWCTAEDASGTRITSHQAVLTADGEIIEQLELQYIGKIFEKSAINFAKFGIQTENLLNGDSNVTYEEMEFVMAANPSTQVLSINLKQEITSRRREEQLYAKAIKRKVSLSYIKILALGPGQVGKSTFVRRLLGIMEGNIQTSSSESQPQCSTGVTELREACIQYSRVTGVINKRNWCIMQDELHSQLSGLMSLIVKQSQKDPELVQSAETTEIKLKDDEHVYPVAKISQTVAKELLTDDALPWTEKQSSPLTEGIEIPFVDSLPVTKGSRQHTPMPLESDIEKTIKDFKALEEDCRNRLERMEFDMLCNIADVGGQPAFLEMLPCLTIGPALYLVFMRLKQGLASRYNVQFKCKDSRNKLFENYSYTSEEVMFTALSSIACFGHPDEEVEMYIRNPSSQIEKQNLRKDSLALLVGTFLDEIQDDEQLKLEDVANQLEKRLEGTAFYKEGLIHRKGFSLLVNNMSAEDSEIIQQRDLLEKILRDKFREYQIPTQWLKLSICLKLLAKNQNKYHVSFDDCVLLGGYLSMDKDMVSVALQFLHKYIGLVMYFPHHENLEKIVICDPQVVFSTISKLIFNIYDHNTNQVSQAQYDHFVQTGCFSPQDITLANNKNHQEKKELLSIDTLVDLLVYLNIAAKLPIAKDEYFLPAVLQTAKIDIVKREHNLKNGELLPEPICFRFKTGFIPLGFVCALSASLIAEDKFHLLTRESNKFYKNRIQLRFQGKFNITMISWPRYAEFRVTRHSGSDEFWSENCCPLINKIVCTAANKVIQSMQHGLRSVAKNSKIYELAFHCPRHPNADFGQESLAELLYDQAISTGLDKFVPNKAICTNPECVTAIDPLTPEMMVWFGKVPNTPLIIKKKTSRKGNVISISAEGVHPLSYQWFVGKIEICGNSDYEGCCTDSLVILGVHLLSQGVYKCQVKDKFGNCVESDELDLFQEVLRKGNLQEEEIIKLKHHGFRSVRELPSVSEVDKLDFLNMAEKRRIKLLLTSIQEKNSKGTDSLYNCEKHWKDNTSQGTASDVGAALQELMDKYDIDAVQLDQEIPCDEVPVIAAYFDSVELFSQAMGLSAADQATVRITLLQYGAQTAMARCLSIWKELDPFKAKFRALLVLLLRLNRKNVAAQICQHLARNMEHC